MIQVKFSADGNFLYTGARKDPEIMCWDVRYSSEVVYTLQRDTADTNQRIQFDIEPVGRHLATGERMHLAIDTSDSCDNNDSATSSSHSTCVTSKSAMITNKHCCSAALAIVYCLE